MTPQSCGRTTPPAMLQAERLWKWITLHDYFAGNFMWTGIDYLGESTWPFKGFASGAMDITGLPKDSYYLYQSLWTDQPVLRLFPHWNWPGRDGQVIPVLAYTNCNIVELFLNGRSLGEKRLEFPAQGTSGGWNTYALPLVNPTTTDLHLSWDVPYEPGVLRAVGKRRDGTVACRREVRTAGPPAAIRLSVDRDTITTGAGDVAHVTLRDRGLGRDGRSHRRTTWCGSRSGGGSPAGGQCQPAGPGRPIGPTPPRVQRPRAGDSSSGRAWRAPGKRQLGRPPLLDVESAGLAWCRAREPAGGGRK